MLMLFLLVPATAGADIYKYVDENGVIVLTDTPMGKHYVKLDATGKASRADDVHSIIVKKADKYSLDPKLIHAVITAESAFDSRAISRKGAMGLMQLMPGTAKDMGVRNPFNPVDNIEGGTRYLKYLIEKYDGDLTRALAAYNAGPKRVETSSSLPSETKKYIRKIYSIYTGERRLSPTTKKKAVIYKITLDDGRILFTNTPPVKKARQSL